MLVNSLCIIWLLASYGTHLRRAFCRVNHPTFVFALDNVQEEEKDLSIIQLRNTLIMNCAQRRNCNLTLVWFCSTGTRLYYIGYVTRPDSHNVAICEMFIDWSSIVCLERNFVFLIILKATNLFSRRREVMNRMLGVTPVDIMNIWDAVLRLQKFKIGLRQMGAGISRQYIEWIKTVTYA